jgi:hypothetical protein
MCVQYWRYLAKNVYNMSSRVKPNSLFVAAIGERTKRHRSGFAETGYI